MMAKKIVVATLTCLKNSSFALLMACSTLATPVSMLPTPPEHPALEKPELMTEVDRARLADFYRRYEVYLKKLQAWKKVFGG